MRGPESYHPEVPLEKKPLADQIAALRKGPLSPNALYDFRFHMLKEVSPLAHSAYSRGLDERDETRGREGAIVRERVVVRAISTPGEDRPSKIVLETRSFSNEPGEQFSVQGLSSTDMTTLASLGGVQLDVSMRVVANNQDEPLSSTAVELERLNGIQEIYNGNPGDYGFATPVLVQGTVLSYEYSPEGGKGSYALHLQLPNGRDAHMKRDSRAHLSSPEFEILSDNKLCEGDLIEYIGEAKEQVIGNRDVVINLVTPSEERRNADAKQREQVAADLAELSQLESPEAIRNRFSQIIGSHKFFKKAILSLALTTAERARLQEVMNEKLPEEEDKPAVLSEIESEDVLLKITKIDARLGITVGSMTKGELRNFYRGFLNGQHQMFDANEFPIEILSFLPDAEKNTLLRETVTTLYPQMLEKKLPYASDDSQDPVTFAQIDLLKQAGRELADDDSVATVRNFHDLVEQFATADTIYGEGAVSQTHREWRLALLDWTFRNIVRFSRDENVKSIYTDLVPLFEDLTHVLSFFSPELTKQLKGAKICLIGAKSRMVGSLDEKSRNNLGKYL